MTETRVFHGGDLGWAEDRFGRADGKWIDLSTGVNPWPYPVGAITAEAWSRLPQAGPESELRGAAARYYGAADAECVVPAPGSQALIQLLPRLRPPGRVAVLGPTYGEHAPCWEAAGHDVQVITDDDIDGPWDVVVLTNPNNPDGAARSPAMLGETADRLARRGGWLVADEAFTDVVPGLSLAGSTDRPGRIVLRSFGKFFGLPGVRLGFALAPADIAGRIAAALGPWAVSAPAIEVGARALGDDAWIAATRDRLAAAARRLDDALGDGGLAVTGGTSLFRLAEHPAATGLFQTLGEHGILVRHFPDRPDRLRFGLPPDDAAVARLAQALAAAVVS
jgi:cobalamin biosynthetic protein CobC